MGRFLMEQGRRFVPAMLLLLASATGMAATEPLRNPQVQFDSAGLQSLLSSLDPGIDVDRDQIVFSSPPGIAPGCWDFDVWVAALADTTFRELGCYATTESPPMPHMILPPSAAAGYRVECHFLFSSYQDVLPSGLRVILFDSSGNMLGAIDYPGLEPTHFGFYVVTSSGTRYTEDWRNGGHPQVLVFADGTPLPSEGRFFGFEFGAYDPASSTFSGAVIEVIHRACGPVVPTRASTWGKLKALYR